MGTNYQYKRLDNHNFTGHSLDEFVRHQTVTECWRKTDNDWKLVPNVYEENWSQAQCREMAEDVAHHINLDQTGFGAFDGERIIGFATVSHRIFGAAARYAQLVCFQISEAYRRQGVGRKLFSMACEEARRLGADKLYVSAHSSKESQAAYRALGCSFAEEINEELAAAEPFDVQMEYRLYPYEINGTSHVSAMSREDWLGELTDHMIRWAESRQGSSEYAGWCLSFIEDALEKSNGIEIFGGDSAKASALLYADGMRQGKPERGAFVFYDCICRGPDGPVNWGHCGICLGDGKVIHAWDVVRIDDYREIEAMTALSGDRPRYIGWVPVERVLQQKGDHPAV